MHKSRHGIVHARALLFCFLEGGNEVAGSADKESQAETLSTQTQLDEQPLAPNRRFSRLPAIVVSLSALVLVGAAAAAHAWPNFSSALPTFDRLAELFPRAAASAPTPDPVVSAALKDIQSLQQQNAAALNEKLRRSATKQSFAEGRCSCPGVVQAELCHSADQPERNIQSTLLASGASGCSTKCGDAADNVFHHTATCSCEDDWSVAQKNI